MKNFKLGIQLYSVRDDAANNLDATLRALSEMGYEGVELAGFYGYTPAEFRALASSHGLEIISAHTGLWEFRGDKTIEQVIAQYVEAGCKYVAIASVANEDRPGGANWESARETFLQIAAECEKQGIAMLYHNHDFEFKKMPDGRYMLEWLYDCVHATEIDICWAHIVGTDLAALLAKHNGKAPLLHLKDYVGDHPQAHYDTLGVAHTVAPDAKDLMLMPVGRGVQNVPAVLNAAEQAGTEWLIVEQDSPAEGDTPMQSAGCSAKYLRELLGK